MSGAWILYAIFGIALSIYGFWLKYKDEKKH